MRPGGSWPKPPDTWRSAKAKGDFMNSLNSILLEGSLADDPKKTALPSGNQVCTFIVKTHLCAAQYAERMVTW